MGIEENRNIRKKVEGSDTVRNLEFSSRMKIAVSEENLGREESRSRKEKFAESNIGRKL